jgi:GNAT superfamily N-acetyltransferase
MAVTIRLLQPSEEHLANNFFNEVYQTNRPLQNFEWEFINGPFGKAIYVIAVDDSVLSFTKIVGIQCAIPIELISSQGQVILTAKSEDTLVDPAYRGQKIFERMYDLLFDACRKAGIKYIWGFTPANKAFERLGFEIPFKAEQALLVFKPVAAFRYLKKLNTQNKTKDKISILGLSVLSWLKGLKNNFTSASALKEVPIQAKDSLFKRAYQQENYFTLNETDAYLTWRLHKNPFQNTYKNFQSADVAFDALINFRKDVSYIEQVISKPGTAIQSELSSLIKAFRKQGTPLIRTFCFSSNEVLIHQGASLTEAGFTYLKRGSYFVWKSLDDKNEISANRLLINRLFTQGNL